MSTYSRHVVDIRSVEFHVPAPSPLGATWVEVAKAAIAAEGELRAASRIARDAEAPDDLIRIRSGDDVIIVSYEERIVDAPGPTEGSPS